MGWFEAEDMAAVVDPALGACRVCCGTHRVSNMWRRMAADRLRRPYKKPSFFVCSAQCAWASVNYDTRAPYVFYPPPEDQGGMLFEVPAIGGEDLRELACSR